MEESWQHRTTVSVRFLSERPELATDHARIVTFYTEAKVNRLTPRQLESLQNAVNALNEFIVESTEGALKDSGTLDGM